MLLQYSEDAGSMSASLINKGKLNPVVLGACNTPPLHNMASFYATPKPWSGWKVSEGQGEGNIEGGEKHLLTCCMS